MKMRKLTLIVMSLFVMGFGASCGTLEQSTGAGVLIGAGTGAAIDKKDRWRGGAIGGVVGGVIGYGIGKQKQKEKEQDRRIRELQRRQSNDPMRTQEPKNVWVKEQPQVKQEPQEVVIIKRKKVIEVEEQVPVQKETRKYYIDPETGKKVYVK